MEIKEEYNKWRSRRWIITVWAMAMITITVIVGTICGNAAYVALATALTAIPTAFTSLETVRKWHEGDRKKEGDFE